MLLSSFIALGLSYFANAWLNETQDSNIWVTITTDIFTTFCPSQTQFAYGSKTYTATASELVTITDCPCTFSHKYEPTGDIIQKPSTPATRTPTSSSPTPSTPKPNSSTAYPPSPSFSNATVAPPHWITTTEIVNKFTTFVSTSTELVHNSRTYTVTVPTTLTITECPCTISKTVPGTTNTMITSVTFETPRNGVSTKTVPPSDLSTNNVVTNSVPTFLSAKTYPVSSAGSTTISPISSPSPKSSNSLSTLSSPSPLSPASLSKLSSPSPMSAASFSTLSSPSPMSPASLSTSPSITVPQGSAFSLKTVSKPTASATTTQPVQITGNTAIRTNAKPVALAFAFFAAILL